MGCSEWTSPKDKKKGGGASRIHQPLAQPTVFAVFVRGGLCTAGGEGHSWEKNYLIMRHDIGACRRTSSSYWLIDRDRISVLRSRLIGLGEIQITHTRSKQYIGEIDLPDKKMPPPQRQYSSDAMAERPDLK